MRFSILALLAGAAACSSYSTTNLIVPDDDGVAGTTSLATVTGERGGSSATSSGHALTGGATVAVTSGATGVGGTSSTGGTQAENTTIPSAGGAVSSLTGPGNGGTTASTATASGGSSIGTGGISAVVNECSKIYEPCGPERACTSFSRVQYGTCFYGSFYCGKYIVWYYENGPVSACNHTERGCSPGTEFERYYQSNCSTGTGGATGAGGWASTGGSVSVGFGGSNSLGGTTASAVSTAKSTQVAVCSDKSDEMPCQYHNDPSDPSKCIGEPMPGINKCRSVLTASCNRGYGAYYCWKVCSECDAWGPNSLQCGSALKDVPSDITSCSKLYPEQ